MQLNLRKDINLKGWEFEFDGNEMELKNGIILLNGQELTDETIEASDKKKKIYETIVKIIEKHNKEVEAIAEAEDEAKSSMRIRDVEELDAEWSVLKDMRTKASNILKEKTIKKLEELNVELETSGMWNCTRICRVAFYDYGVESGKYDEEAALFWTKGEGFGIKYFERNKYTGDGYDWVEVKEPGRGETVNIKDPTKRQIKKIAKALPNRIKELTADYRNEIRDINKLIAGL